MKTLKRSSTRVLGAICCVCCAIVLLCSGTQQVYAQNTAEIVAVSTNAEKGGIAQVTIELKNNPGMWGIKFEVGYNQKALTLKTISVGNVFTQSEITMPESLNQEKYIFYATSNDIKNNTKNGNLVVLEFQVSADATAADYDIRLELVQCINVDGDDVSIKMKNGKITMAECLHTQTRWEVIKSATCEAKGSKKEICKRCEKVLGTKETKATGHVKTIVKNAVEATETQKGYTGDIYCKTCNKLVEKGKVIPKLQAPGENNGDAELPWGGIVIGLLLVALLGAVAFLYVKYRKEGKLPNWNKILKK